MIACKHLTPLAASKTLIRLTALLVGSHSRFVGLAYPLLNPSATNGLINER